MKRKNHFYYHTKGYQKFVRRFRKAMWEVYEIMNPGRKFRCQCDREK